MRVRFFGDPWPHEERRAPICEDDKYKVPVPVGQKCIECSEQIKENQRGVITACSMRIWGHFWLEFPAVEGDFFGEEEEEPCSACKYKTKFEGQEPCPHCGGTGVEPNEAIGRMVKMPVAAYHLSCWLREVVGGEMSEKIQDRMHLRPGDVPLTPKEIDELEEQGLSVGDETAEPGGWFR